MTDEKIDRQIRELRRLGVKHVEDLDRVIEECKPPPGKGS